MSEPAFVRPIDGSLEGQLKILRRRLAAEHLVSEDSIQIKQVDGQWVVTIGLMSADCTITVVESQPTDQPGEAGE